MPGAANGLGPWWFPAPIRAALTSLSARFFREAAWWRHDIGYARGHPSRAECDKRFLGAMLRDASRCEATWRMWACVTLAALFWLAVRLFGWTAYARHASDR